MHIYMYTTMCSVDCTLVTSVLSGDVTNQLIISELHHEELASKPQIVTTNDILCLQCFPYSCIAMPLLNNYRIAPNLTDISNYPDTISNYFLPLITPDSQ